MLFVRVRQRVPSPADSVMGSGASPPFVVSNSLGRRQVILRRRAGHVLVCLGYLPTDLVLLINDHVRASPAEFGEGSVEASSYQDLGTGSAQSDIIHEPDRRCGPGYRHHDAGCPSYARMVEHLRVVSISRDSAESQAAGFSRRLWVLVDDYDAATELGDALSRGTTGRAVSNDDHGAGNFWRAAYVTTRRRILASKARGEQRCLVHEVRSESHGDDRCGNDEHERLFVQELAASDLR